MLKLSVELEVKPRAGQSQEDAEAEMTLLFRQFLTLPEADFQESYGLEAWGGWEGPFVTENVRVEREA